MKTCPFDMKDYLLWPLLRVLWTPLVGGKVSYWWHWIDWRLTPQLAVAIPETELDKTAQERTNRWQSFFQTNFGWKKTVLFQPADELYAGLSTRQVHAYRIGFKAGNTIQLCSIILYGPAAPLLGPGPVSFFAYSYPDNREIKLQILGYYRLRRALPGYATLL